MTISTSKQISLVYKKNLMIFVKEKQYIYELVAPLICFILLIVAKNHEQNYIIRVTAVEFLPMSLIVTTRFMVTNLISEKSERQKEIQKIMGLKPISYTIGWFLTNLSRLAYVSIFFLLLTVPTNCLDPYNGIGQFTFGIGAQMGSFILYGLSLMALAYFISSIFDSPRNGADLSIFLNLLGSICSQFLSLPYFSQHKWIIYMFSLMPSFCYDIIPYAEIGSKTSNSIIDFSTTDYYCMLSIDIFLFAILYLYLDQVLPNEYGTNKHPFFFLGIKNDYYSQKNESLIDTNNVDLNQPLFNQLNTYDTSSAYYHEPFENIKQVKRAVQLINVKKQFGDLLAVNGISLSLYESQLLCLLGHNGAGKTTILSTMIGLITKDSGQILYYGQSIDDSLDEIRQFIGICPQKDALYDSLTIEDHLWYYAKIKGVEDDQLNQQIDQAINKCALTQERGKLAKNLSGGNKRKLSLAMALIGSSKVIFLDEPTSGMDPVSRRKIWDILIQMKNDGRCLVLTTHHLDEAEVLSERLAVMAKGKLLTVGSVDFVKVNFGIGYHLIIDNISNPQDSWKSKQNQLTDYVKKVIPEASLNQQTSNQTLSFQLPFNQKEKLLQILTSVENDETISINLMMNTLEEAFINIGMDEEQFIQKAKRYSTSKVPDIVTVDVNVNDEFSKIVPPQCLTNSPNYSFWNQFYACYIRRHYAMSGKRLIIQLIIPGVFIILGPIASFLFYRSKDYQNLQIEALIGLLNSYDYTIFGLCIASSQIGSIPVQERELSQKYAMNVMGLRSLPYWTASYVYDLSICAFLLICYLISVYACLQTPLQIFDVFALQFICFVCYVPLSYLLSWLFTSHLSALRAIVVIQVFIIFVVPYVMYFIFRKDHWLIWILTIIFPSISYIGGFTAIYKSMYYQEPINIQALDIMPYDPISESPWLFMVILLLQATLYFIITLLIDNRALLGTNQQLQSFNQTHDEDVINEAQRVAQNGCTDRVIANQISKIYQNGFLALKGTSFGVEPGQIFGLLGPNGAGKSTTFNLITCRLKPTSGKIVLQQQEIKKGMGEIFQNIGICPQFDSLFETLTPIEHLKVWAYMKGLKGKDAEDATNYFINVMQLSSYSQTQASKLSGGNKRKLCVALALMGGTNMQFFDEPSSGVDPIARRFLWNAIQQGVKLRQSSVILTTHTMDEAESLCSKIAIQVNGQFACIGTPSHLKRKFGEGYRLTIELVEQGNKDEVIEKIKEQFENVQLIPDDQSHKLIFKIAQIKLNKAFDFLLNNLQKDQKLIKDFQINQTNLEQIFMYFASLQQESTQQQQQKELKSKQPWYQNLSSCCCSKDEDS